MKITLDYIAEKSGVSKTTVSYILNNKQTSMGISESTREKVKKVMEELKYFPDKTAVALGKRNKRKTKVLILTPWLNTANSQFMINVSKAVEGVKKVTEADYRMYIAGELEELIVNRKNSAYDYFVVIGTSRKDDDFLRDYPEKNRILLLNRKIDGYTYVSCDNFTGGGLIAEHCLRSSYYERYVILTNKKVSQALEEREKGIADYFIRNNHRKPQLEYLNDWSDNDFAGLLENYGRNKVLFFTLQDNHAVRLSSFMQKNKISIPDCAGITGYDNDPITAIVYPSITTIDSKNFEMAEKAFEKILNKEQGPSLITPELVVRKTTI